MAPGILEEAWAASIKILPGEPRAKIVSVSKDAPGLQQHIAEHTNDALGVRSVALAHMLDAEVDAHLAATHVTEQTVSAVMRRW